MADNPTADELRAARRAAQLTLRRLASLIGGTPQQLSSWETGKVMLGADRYQAWLAACAAASAARNSISDPP